MADNLVLGDLGVVVTGLAALLAFVTGAMTTAIMINWTRRRRLRSTFALPLMLEALPLLCSGLLGATLDQRLPLMVPATVLVLCYLMGLQNVVITKVSRAEIRTTHMTGIVTDLGIELGKLIYRNVSPGAEPVRADRIRLRLHLLLLGAFFVGGVAGALGFRYFSYSATIPLALILAGTALRPLIEDATLRYRLVRRNSPAAGDGAPTFA